MRTLIYAFWAFIIIMLLWQAYNYNQSISDRATAQKEQHYFYFDTNVVNPAGPNPPPAPVRHTGAYVVQSLYTVEQNQPSRGNFTCHVTLKNEGEAKAVNVQVQVRPYRGSRTDDEDLGVKYAILNDNAPLAQIGQWVSFPDLDPGQSSTQSTVFFAQQGAQMGPNKDPQINYDTATNAPAQAAPSP